MAETHHDALRGLITLGQIDASDILLIQYRGRLPVSEELQSRYHQLHGPVHITWQEMDPALSGGFTHEHGSSESIEIDSTLNNGSDTALAMAVGQAMIRSLLERTVILVPDEWAPRNALQRYFGFEMNEVLSEKESPEERQNRELDMSGWRGGIGQQLQKTEILLRLHNIMVARAWETERIPESRFELYAALAAEGLPLPEKMELLLSQTESGKEATALFGLPMDKPSEHNFDPLVPELGKALSKLSEVQQERFWEEVAPAYYGDLLTLYGHRNGRGSMGLKLLP